MTQVQQGSVLDDLDDKIDFLVVSDLNGSKTIQKKAMTLNGKGAAIRVIDADGCKKLVEPTEADILALLRTGEVRCVCENVQTDVLLSQFRSSGQFAPGRGFTRRKAQTTSN